MVCAPPRTLHSSCVHVYIYIYISTSVVLSRGARSLSQPRQRGSGCCPHVSRRCLAYPSTPGVAALLPYPSCAHRHGDKRLPLTSPSLAALALSGKQRSRGLAYCVDNWMQPAAQKKHVWLSLLRARCPSSWRPKRAIQRWRTACCDASRRMYWRCGPVACASHSGPPVAIAGWSTRMELARMRHQQYRRKRRQLHGSRQTSSPVFDAQPDIPRSRATRREKRFLAAAFPHQMNKDAERTRRPETVCAGSRTGTCPHFQFLQRRMTRSGGKMECG